MSRTADQRKNVRKIRARLKVKNPEENPIRVEYRRRRLALKDGASDSADWANFRTALLRITFGIVPLTNDPQRVRRRAAYRDQQMYVLSFHITVPDAAQRGFLIEAELKAEANVNRVGYSRGVGALRRGKRSSRWEQVTGKGVHPVVQSRLSLLLV